MTPIYTRILVYAARPAFKWIITCVRKRDRVCERVYGRAPAGENGRSDRKEKEILPTRVVVLYERAEGLEKYYYTILL